MPDKEPTLTDANPSLPREHQQLPDGPLLLPAGWHSGWHGHPVHRDRPSLRAGTTGPSHPALLQRGPGLSTHSSAGTDGSPGQPGAAGFLLVYSVPNINEMVPINKGREPFLTPWSMTGAGRRAGVLAGDQAGDLDQQAPENEQEGQARARSDPPSPAARAGGRGRWAWRAEEGQELPRILSM